MSTACTSGKVTAEVGRRSLMRSIPYSIGTMLARQKQIGTNVWERFLLLFSASFPRIRILLQRIIGWCLVYQLQRLRRLRSILVTALRILLLLKKMTAVTGQ